MKRNIKLLIIAVCFLPAFAIGQSVFDKFEDSDKIGSVSINKGMLGIVANMSADKADRDTQDFIDLAKSVNSIKVFVSEDASTSQEMASTAKKYVKASKLESLMKVKEDDTQVDFYVREGKNDDYVSEMVMLVTGMDKKSNDSNFETVLVTMTGDIDLTKIGALVNKMNLPKDLKKAGKN